MKETTIKSKLKSKPLTDSLNDIQKLVINLNASLLELKGEKDEYQTQINECTDLCHKIRELMDATTARIIKSGESQLSY